MSDRDKRYINKLPVPSVEELLIKNINDVKTDITLINSNIDLIETSISDLELKAIAYSIAL